MATMTETTVTTPTPGELVSAKTICLVLKIGRFGNSKKASMGPVEVDADKSLLRLSKTLLDSPELVALVKHDAAFTRDIRALAFSSLFKGGVHMIPIALVPKAEDIITAAIARRAALVDLVVAAYEKRRDETAGRLGVTFNPADYPSVERFKSLFYLDYSYVTFETPTRLKAISAALFESEAAKARTRLESVANECEQTMRAGLLDLVDHLAERLSPSEDGKAKRLSHSTIGHLNEFLETFELKNVTDDSQLADIVTKARAVMAGVDHKTLKSDELIRQKMVEQLTAVKAALDPLVVDKATRQIDLDGDDE